MEERLSIPNKNDYGQFSELVHIAAVMPSVLVALGHYVVD